MYHSQFFLKIYLFYFQAVVGLCCCFCCCTRAFSSGRKQGLLFIAAWRASHCGSFSCCRAWPLGMQASVVAVHGLSSCSLWALEHRLSSCDTQAQLLCNTWDLPGPGIEPVSLASQGGFLITGPPLVNFYLLHILFESSKKKKQQKNLTVEPIILYIIPKRNLPSKHQRYRQLCKNLHLY